MVTLDTILDKCDDYSSFIDKLTFIINDDTLFSSDEEKVEMLKKLIDNELFEFK